MCYLLSWKFDIWDLRRFQFKTAVSDYMFGHLLKCDISM